MNIKIMKQSSLEGNNNNNYDREEEIKALKKTIASTKGLVDGGIQKVPKVFIQQNEHFPENTNSDLQVPVVDMTRLGHDPNTVVAEIKEAVEKWGFFMVVNHGIPEEVLGRTMKDFRGFHEQESHVKAQYLAETSSEKKVRFRTSFDDFNRRTVGNWRDTLVISNSEDGNLDPNILPDVCRISNNHIGGLQVLYENRWVDVHPVPGSLVVNIGDILQMILNDRIKSVCHRVKANGGHPRISSAFFFTGVTTPPRIYGPIKELVSEQNPALYREFSIKEYSDNYFTRPFNEPSFQYFMI